MNTSETESLFDPAGGAEPAIECDPGIRDAVAILAASPEPVSLNDLLAILRRLGWEEAQILAAPQLLNALTESGVLVQVLQNYETARRIRIPLREHRHPDDLELVQTGYRLLFDAIQKEGDEVPDVVWRHAAHIAARAGDNAKLRKFLKDPAHYRRMAQAGSPVIAIPYWCEAVSALDAARRLKKGQRLNLLRPVLRDVVDELEHQYYSMGRLSPVVDSLTDLLEKEDDETLVRAFDECVAEMPPLGSISPETRGVLALIQLFGEANMFDRQMQLAESALAQHDDFDVHHFATVGCSHFGRHLPGHEGRPLLHSALEGVRRATGLTGAADTASFPLRHTTVALSHYGLGLADRNDNKNAEANTHFRTALRHIKKRKQNAQVLGYKAQILMALGEADEAWAAARESLSLAPGGLDAGEVLLHTASADALNPRFTPYATLQAVSCSLTHGPFVNAKHRDRIVGNTAIPFLVRERNWPMAVALDGAKAELTSPGIAAACERAYAGERRITVAVGSSLLNAIVDVWEFPSAEDGPVTVLGLAEFGIYARGRTMDVATVNLGSVIQRFCMRRRPTASRIRPIDFRVQHWLSAHLSGEPVRRASVHRDASREYYRGRPSDAWAKLSSIEAGITTLTPHHLREYRRAHAWIAAEVGQADAMQSMHDHFELDAPTLSTFTDLQKAGAARGLTPHPIVEAVHDVVQARGLTQSERFFSPIERLYIGMYWLSVGRNADAEQALAEALEFEMDGPREARLLARIGDALSEALRRRGELDLARRMLEDNIQSREAEGISIAGSLVQRAKCAENESAALADMEQAISLYSGYNRKELVRALLLQARMMSDAATQKIVRTLAAERARNIPALKTDENLRNVLNRWGDWCRPSFGPELDYWNL